MWQRGATAARARHQPRHHRGRTRLHRRRILGLRQRNYELLREHRSHWSHQSRTARPPLPFSLALMGLIDFVHEQVGSRRVILSSSFMMLAFGVFSKFGALFVTIPEPLIGGIFCVMFGIITAAGTALLVINCRSNSIFQYVSGKVFCLNQQ